jgi:DNA-binding response OmpR family regulator
VRVKKLDPLVLIVDSEPGRSEPIARALSQSGFLTITLNSASDALDLCRDPRYRVDLVLTRIILGAMSGFDLAETIEEEGLPAKILLISHHKKELLRSIPRFAKFRDRFIHSPASDEEIQTRVLREFRATTAA